MIKSELSLEILNILPNPVLVKDSQLRYVWVNRAFEQLFSITCQNLVGKLDTDAFPDRQAAQCNGGDLRVLNTGEIDEAQEIIYQNNTPLNTITRKSRLTIGKETYLVGVMHDITELTKTNQELEISKNMLEEQSNKLTEMDYYDPLTGVLNRRRLNELAPIVFGTSRNTGCVLLFDLDYFKKVNDQWGHDAGDLALIHFIEILKKSLRDGDLIARIGGEEFVSILPGLKKDKGHIIAERIRNTLEKNPLSYQDQSIYMTVSIGMNVLENAKTTDLDKILTDTDKLLYKATNAGRNTISIGKY